jgi:hypothetical protein
MDDRGQRRDGGRRALRERAEKQRRHMRCRNRTREALSHTTHTNAHTRKT